MTDLLLVCCLAGLANFAVWFAVKNPSRRSVERSCREIASRLGLTVFAGDLFRTAEVSGRLDGIAVRLYFIPTDTRYDAMLALDGRTPPDGSLSLSREDPMDRLLHGPDVEVSSARFDASVCMNGPEWLILAALDGRTRELVRRVIVEGEAVLANGSLRQMRIPWPHDPDRLRLAILDAVALVRAVAVPAAEVPARLAAHAREDAEPGVRLRNLRMLIARYPKLELARRTCLALANGPVPELALEATLFLAREGDMAGRARLRALADDEERDRAVRAHAMAALGNPDDEPLLLNWLTLGQPRLVVAAAGALAEVGTSAAVARLERHTGGLATDADVTRAARAAIERIQARLPRARAGQLSLSEAAGATGALSEANRAAGALSEPAKAAGRLSKPRGEGGAGAADTGGRPSRQGS